MGSGLHETIEFSLRRELAQAHIKDGIIRILHYHTTHDKLPLVERILRDEFRLVDADGFKDKDELETLGIVPHETVSRATCPI